MNIRKITDYALKNKMLADELMKNVTMLENIYRAINCNVHLSRNGEHGSLKILVDKLIDDIKLLSEEYNKNEGENNEK